MIFLRTQADRADQPDRPARSRAAVAVETLEGRALLSHMNVAAQAGLPVSVQRFHPGPILNEIGRGFAVKVPRFYLFYLGNGPARAELNGASSTALVINGGSTLELNGEVAGQIVTQPTKPDQNEYYVFGVNRGGATTPGPFPQRPHITFDAVVSVSITQSGIVGTVQNLTGNTTPTTLDPSNIQIKADTLKVFVPLNLLPPTGRGGAGAYSVNFWAKNQPTTDYHQIASFTPEFRDYRVVVTH